jgi:hypothetical protein
VRLLAAREPIPYNLELLQRDVLDPEARGFLREDRPNYWKADQHALSNLTVGSGSDIVDSFSARYEFPDSIPDDIPDDNKYIIVALLRHVLDVFKHRYIRKEPVKVPHLETMSTFRISYPILYVSSEPMWDELVRLANVPGADGALTEPAARELNEFLDEGIYSHGSLVSAHDLEQCLEHGRSYYEDFAQAASRRPVLDMNDLDSDDIHAFLCAYATCFPPQENAEVQNRS